MPPRPVIYVDVDDTFLRSAGSKRLPMTGMVELIRAAHALGAELYCWSTAGADYARASAEEAGIAHCFAAFLPKPRVLLDDVAFSRWRVLELHPNECSGLTAEELLERARGS